MTKWKMVPSFLTPEMWAAGASTNGLEASYQVMLAAAPKWEPSESDVERALETFCCVGPTDKHAMRAAILAAVGGGE